MFEDLEAERERGRRKNAVVATVILVLFTLWVWTFHNCGTCRGSEGEPNPHPEDPNYLTDADYFTVMSHMPIPTVDVLLMDSQHTKTLLFKRSNRPVQGVWYSLGGRLYKNERIEDAAARKLLEEIGVTCNHPLPYTGVVQEIFEDSMFDGSDPEHPERITNSHCYNSVFYCEVDPDELSTKMVMDGQHNNFRWFSTSDPLIHPLMREKIALVTAHKKSTEATLK